MDNIFQTMFSREPEQIHGSAYYFDIPDVPGFDNTYTPEQEAMSNGIDPEEALKQCKVRMERDFLPIYNSRDIHSAYDGITHWRFQRFLQGREADNKITDFFREIAAKEIPFVDLGSYHMGMAPYILHLHSGVPCLLTNRDRHHVSALRSCIQENLANPNISIACCDEVNIPLQRQSIEVVTGVSPFSGASQNRIVDSRVMSLDEMCKWCTIGILMEVYRVLKPGGYFIFSEFASSLHFSWTELDHYFQKHDKMYGLYSKEELYESLRYHKNREKYCLNDDMIKMAGFDIEVKDSYSFKEELENMPNWFYKDAFPEKTRELIPDDDIIELQFADSLYVLRKNI